MRRLTFRRIHNDTGQIVAIKMIGREGLGVLKLTERPRIE